MKCGPGRKRNGQWCLTETTNYKMTNHFGQFNKDSLEAFNEAASERYDFSTCQRPDGSYYGTGGTCKKGSPVSGGVPKKEKKGKAPSGGGGGGPTRGEIADKRKEVRQMDKTAKAADKKANDADKAWRKAGSPKGPQQQNVKKLDRAAKSANKEANKGQKELERMSKSASNAKKRQSNVNVNKALESGNKTQLRKAQADIGGKIAKLEAAGKPVPKSLRATSKLLRDKMES